MLPAREVFNALRWLVREGFESTVKDAAASYGAMTIRPGTCEYQDEKSWLCWAATRAAAPFGPRNTMLDLI